MYNQFQSLQKVNFNEMTYISKKFEIWTKGVKIREGSTECVVNFKFDENEMINVSILNNNVIDFVLSSFSFDIAYTLHDRILLSIIPVESNLEDYDSFVMFRESAPIRTRESKQFVRNEPYASSLFFINNLLEKVTFSTGIPGTLIELYC